MANGVQLATAYISLNVRTDGIKKQVESALNGVGSQGRQAGSTIGSNIVSGIREHMSGGKVGAIFAPIAVAGVRWAGTAGRAIGTALRTAIVSSVSLGLGAAVLGATAALTAGLDRLKTIQRAQVQLSLKLAPEEIRRVTKDIQDVVKGTPIALDEALQAVPRALSAGIKPGKELNQYVQNIADAAASSGGQAGFGQIDIIFSQILSKGKLMGEELMQLAENGVDLRSALRDTIFNGDDKKLNAAIAKGKVGMKEIQQAVEATWGKDGGLSKKMGNTFDGAVGNLKASVARLGANVLGLIFGDPNNPDDPLRGAIDGVTSFTEKIDTMGKWVATHREDIRGYFNGAKDAATGLWNGAKKVWEWLGKAKDVASELWGKAEDVGTKIASGFNTATRAVESFVNKIKDIWTNLKTWVVDKWDAVFGPNSPIGKFMNWLGVGPATANAAAPGGSASGAAPFNPGPMAPSVAAGQSPLGGSTQGLSSVPAFGIDANGNPLTSTGGGINPGPMAPGAKPSTANLQEPRKVGSDQGLLQDTIGLKDYLTTAFPEISDVGGYRDTDYTPFGVINEHSSGKAFDIMVPKGFMDPKTGRPTPEGIAWGDRVLKEALAKGASVLWKQTQFDPDGASSGMADRGDNTQNHWDHLHVLQGGYANYASGGKVWGSGTATSDSIPAMLSNGEHVLTAADVKAMGGQQGVYAFRSALQAGLIPGFAPGGGVGPVDPSVIQQAQDNLANLNNAYAVAQAQMNEVIQKGDATPSEILRAQQNLAKTKREVENAQADLPVIMGGGTPPDRSKQNRVYDVTDQLASLQQQLADQQEAGAEVPYSQQLQQNYQMESLKRERGQAIADLQGTGQGKDYGGEFVRSLGFIPATAGSSTVAGTSSLAGFINMGNSVVSGVIDTGVNLANQAVSAAIAAGATAGSFGAGAAAAPIAQMAASYGIQLAGNQAKRISSYWFGLAGIGADALQEQLFPFGAPRFLGYDYGNYAPQLGIQDAALGTLEQMGSDAITKHFSGQGGNPVIPADPTAGANTAPSGPSAATTAPPAPPPTPAPQNQQLLQPGDPGFYTSPMVPDPFNPNGAGGGGGGGSWARGGAIGVYDNGGVLKPGQLAFNASRTPESILTKQQWNAMAANASSQPKDSAPLVQNLYAQDMQDAIRQLEKVKRRDMMQYAGRP